MAKPRPTNPPSGSDDSSLEESLVASYLADLPGAANALTRHIAPATRRAAAAFMGVDAGDVDDVVQETCLAVLDYLRVQRSFRGNLLNFSTTVARNRCRNILNWKRRHRHVELGSLQDWIATPQRSALDVLAEEETNGILQKVLTELSSDCRRLLRGFYLDNRSMEDLRKDFGLGTVQGVYHRRTKCLERAALLLKEYLGRCSVDEREDSSEG